MTDRRKKTHHKFFRCFSNDPIIHVRIGPPAQRACPPSDDVLAFCAMNNSYFVSRKMASIVSLLMVAILLFSSMPARAVASDDSEKASSYTWLKIACPLIIAGAIVGAGILWFSHKVEGPDEVPPGKLVDVKAQAQEAYKAWCTENRATLIDWNNHVKVTDKKANDVKMQLGSVLRPFTGSAAPVKYLYVASLPVGSKGRFTYVRAIQGDTTVLLDIDGPQLQVFSPVHIAEEAKKADKLWSGTFVTGSTQKDNPGDIKWGMTIVRQTAAEGEKHRYFLVTKMLSNTCKKTSDLPTFIPLQTISERRDAETVLRGQMPTGAMVEFRINRNLLESFSHSSGNSYTIDREPVLNLDEAYLKH